MALDGFFFDVERWFGSVAAQRMSFAEKGVYLSMLFKEWNCRERSLPDDPDAVADLIAITDAQRADVLAAWPVTRRKFITDKRTGRIFNLALEQTRRKQAQNFKNRSNAGKVGGKASAAKRAELKPLEVKQSLTVVQRSSTEKSREEKSREDQKREEVEAFVALWNALIAPPLPACQAVSATRRTHIRKRLSERSLEDWSVVFARIRASAFCRGENDRGWVASFDWVIGSSDVALKVLEGKYDDRRGTDRRSEARDVPDRRDSWVCEHAPLCGSEFRCDQRTQLEAHGSTIWSRA